MNVQIIEKNGRPEWAVIPYAEYTRLYQVLEDAEDVKAIEAYLSAVAEGTEIPVPGAVTLAVLKGKTTIRAWREYRGLTMRELARRIGMTPAYLSQIETDKRNPTVDTLRRIADELEIDIDQLI